MPQMVSTLAAGCCFISWAWDQRDMRGTTQALATDTACTSCCRDVQCPGLVGGRQLRHRREAWSAPCRLCRLQGGGNVDLHPTRCARRSHVDGCVQVVPDVLDFRHICGQGERVVGPAGSWGQWMATDRRVRW